MSTTRDLLQQHLLVSTDAPGVGRVYISDREVRLAERIWVRSLEGTNVSAADYAELHEECHLWVHEDHDNDLWLVVDVDPAVGIGDDYVTFQHRLGNTSGQLQRRPDLAADIAEFALLKDRFGASRAQRTTPRDRFFAGLMAPHVAGSLQAIFSFEDRRFDIMDLCLTAADIRRWHELPR